MISTSKRIIASYVFDWIAIIAIAAVGAGFDRTKGNRRPFALVDLSLSYPYIPHEEIPDWLLVLVGLIAPGIIIFFVSIVFIPGRPRYGTPGKLIWRRKLWEWNAGWMGLGLSVALSFFFTSGLKNLFGKPRPDLLARCIPDLAHIQAHAVGSFAASFNQEWVLVDHTICTTTDDSVLNDGFKSFPSGHASFSWSGLFYLALFLCSKFSVGLPFVPPRDPSDVTTDDDFLPPSEDSASSSRVPPRNRAAAPPVYLLALPLVPICSAIFITSTRYFQYYHHGVDLIAGSLLGVATAWFAFRWYHAPVLRGAGWAWGARSKDRAWGLRVGMSGYVGKEGRVIQEDKKHEDYATKTSGASQVPIESA